MVCGSCSADNPRGAQFCNRCGRALAPAATGAVSPGGGTWVNADVKPEVVPATVTAPTPPPRGAGPPGAQAGPGLVGQVRGVATRSEAYGDRGQRTVWTFRVEQFDSLGNRRALVPVEMRGLSFEGSIADGDWVRVEGKRKRGTLRAKRLENLTTGATVKAKGLPLVAKVVLFVFLIAWLALVLFIASQFFAR